jgi:hypothetical protein
MPRKKKPGANLTKKVAQDIYYKTAAGKANPLMVRDPIPKRGLLEILDCRVMNGLTGGAEPKCRTYKEKVRSNAAHDSYIQMCIDYEKDPNRIEKLRWIEVFAVCDGGKLTLFQPNCMFTGFTASDALGTIPIDNVFEANVDNKMNILDVHTDQQVYRFRSQQKRDVPNWQNCIMNGAMWGMEVNSLDWDDDEDEDASIWKAINQRKAATGGLASALAKPADKLEIAEDNLLKELFCSSGGMDTSMSDKDFIDDQDLMQWAGNRMVTVKDKKKRGELEAMVTPEAIEEALSHAMVYDEENAGNVSFNVFKRSMCDFNSNLRRIVLALLDTFPNMERWEYLEAIFGELSKPEYILMYHMHMNRIVKACRNQLHDNRTDEDVITNNKNVAQVWLSGVEGEVSNLLKKYEEYQAKLRSFDPSLRERVHSCGVDDVFDSHMLPGKRWDSFTPRKSWK